MVGTGSDRNRDANGAPETTRMCPISDTASAGVEGGGQNSRARFRLLEAPR